MITFADKLCARINKVNSVLCAGFDPTAEQMPVFLARNSLLDFGQIFLEAIEPYAACVKFNVAFFEAFGIQGLQTLNTLTKKARTHGLPVIIDAKRGDIGNTAAAYARAWLGEDATCAAGDALTVNPYLGFDTLEPFIQRCKETGTGLFVLVRTSNPGASEMQATVSDTVARFLSTRAAELMGACGRSGLGAVVGATDANYQLTARALMATNLFLVPGYGAQGASASDAMLGLEVQRSMQRSIRGSSSATPSAIGIGGVVNSSRGLVQGAANSTTASELQQLIQSNAGIAAEQLSSRLKSDL